MYLYQITLYTSNVCNVICPLELNKAGEKKEGREGRERERERKKWILRRGSKSHVSVSQKLSHSERLLLRTEPGASMHGPRKRTAALSSAAETTEILLLFLPLLPPPPPGGDPSSCPHPNLWMCLYGHSTYFWSRRRKCCVWFPHPFSSVWDPLLVHRHSYLPFSWRYSFFTSL